MQCTLEISTSFSVQQSWLGLSFRVQKLDNFAADTHSPRLSFFFSLLLRFTHDIISGVNMSFSLVSLSLSAGSVMCFQNLPFVPYISCNPIGFFLHFLRFLSKLHFPFTPPTKPPPRNLSLGGSSTLLFWPFFETGFSLVAV